MWTSGIIATVEGGQDVATRIDGFSGERSHGRYTLRSQITLFTSPGRVKGSGGLLAGMVFDEYLRETRRLVEDPNGRFRLDESHTTKDVQYGRFWMTTESIVVAQRFDTAEFTFRVLEEALGRPITHVMIDVQGMAKDTRGHWLGTITDRTGHVQSATMYGDDIEKDDEMGRPYLKGKKGQIGFWTEYFGARTKVKVTREGSVTIYADLHQDRPRYVSFVKEVVLPYKTRGSARDVPPGEHN